MLVYGLGLVKMIKNGQDHLMLPNHDDLDDRDGSLRERSLMAESEIALTFNMLLLLYRTRSLNYATMRGIEIPLEASTWAKFGFRI